MKVAVGWKWGELRISDRPDFKHGDPDFKHGMNLVITADGTAELSMFANENLAMTMKERTAIARFLASLGCKRVRWTRKEPDGRERLCEFSLERYAPRQCGRCKNNCESSTQ